MIYRNSHIQTRPSVSQPYYWEVRPFGNPHPIPAKECVGFIGMIFDDSQDGLTRSVSTFWESKDAWLGTKPPDVFEQPQFSNWLAERNMGFTWSEEWIEELPPGVKTKDQL